MGSKNKLKRFKENQTFPNVLQPERQKLEAEAFPQKGQWHKFFKNNNPIVVELGCGKGEYTLYLAKIPAVQLCWHRHQRCAILAGAKTALEEKPPM